MAATTSQVTDVVKQVLDKLTEAAQAAGQTVGAAWPHVVTAYAARQIGYMLSGVFLSVLGGILLYFCRNRTFLSDGGHDVTPWMFVAVAGCAILAIGGMIVMTFFGGVAAVLADPAGAFILTLLGK